MIQPRDPQHNLTILKSTTKPKRLLWLDCAAYITQHQGASVARWQCGALGSTRWTAKKGVRHDTCETFTDTAALWCDADGFCKPGKRVVLFAYDLANQLRLSKALVELPALGWHLERIVLERTAAWALFKDGKRTLLMCDLRSWAPVNLAYLSSDLGELSPWPIQHDAGPNFHANISRDRVAIVRESVLQILEWSECENLGPFRPTGSGQSYAAFRRRFLDHTLLVHDDTERLHAERLAMWTGRCEAWQHGALTSGPYVEYDMNAAYCRIAAECDVPSVAEGETRTRNVSKLLQLAESRALLVHCTVTTDVPVLPARMGGRTAWPVGQFSTWIWEPELQLAAEYCNDIKVHRVYTYRRAPALRDFARFVLDGLGPQMTVYGEVPKRVLKLWSRCLVGRLGLRYRSWIPFGSCPDQDLRLVTYIDADDGVSTDMLCAGHDRMILSDMSESPDSLPQIPSWVMSECRARLWRFMLHQGLGAVVYVDTDSVIVSPDASPPRPLMYGGDMAGMWARKGTYKRLTIHGPRNYSTENDRHVSGVPLTARQVAPLEFSGEVMRSIKESMRNGELDCIASIPRTFRMRAGDTRRQHLPYNQTAPFRVQLPAEEF